MNPIRVLMALPEHIPRNKYDVNQFLFIESVMRSKSMDVTKITCDKKTDFSNAHANHDVILFPFITPDLASKADA